MIVDSSKIPSHAFLLSQIPSINLHLLHLVRDSRATAYSWQKKIQRQDAYPDETIPMERYNPVTGSLKWLFWNGILERISPHLNGSYIRINYEDFVRNPEREFRNIAQALDMSRVSFPGNENQVHLNGNHMAWGNPSRMKTGPINLRLDTGWESELSWQTRITVSAITWPLLLKYGYLV